MKTIVWQRKANRQIRHIPKADKVRIFSAVNKLADFPDCEGLDIKTLKGHQYGYRLRVGRYRVLFDAEYRIEIVLIQEVKKRDERTY